MHLAQAGCQRLPSKKPQPPLPGAGQRPEKGIPQVCPPGTRLPPRSPPGWAPTRTCWDGGRGQGRPALLGPFLPHLHPHPRSRGSGGGRGGGQRCFRRTHQTALAPASCPPSPSSPRNTAATALDPPAPTLVQDRGPHGGGAEARGREAGPPPLPPPPPHSMPPPGSALSGCHGRALGHMPGTHGHSGLCAALVQEWAAPCPLPSPSSLSGACLLCAGPLWRQACAGRSEPPHPQWRLHVKQEETGPGGHGLAGGSPRLAPAQGLFLSPGSSAGSSSLP